VKVNKGSVLESEATPSLQEVAWKEVVGLRDSLRRVAIDALLAVKEFLPRLLHGLLFPFFLFLSSLVLSTPWEEDSHGCWVART
jgi:hypothetical protein